MRYEKTYLDLVSDDGVVCVAYDSRLALFGSVWPAAGVEIYGPDGSRRVLRASGRAVRREQGHETELSFSVPGGTFRITQRALHGAFVPEGSAPREGLGWRVRTACAEAVAELELAGVRQRFNGRGYEDLVTIETPTRRLGLATIEWGRAHAGDESLVFNVVESAGGERWSRCCRFGPDAAPLAGDVDLQRSEHGLIVHSSDTSNVLELRTERVLHAGEALDEARFPGRFERALTRVLTGPVHERRTLARASFGGVSGWALEERVELGVRAKTRGSA